MRGLRTSRRAESPTDDSPGQRPGLIVKKVSSLNGRSIATAKHANHAKALACESESANRSTPYGSPRLAIPATGSRRAPPQFRAEPLVFRFMEGNVRVIQFRFLRPCQLSRHEVSDVGQSEFLVQVHQIC